ncbi:MAG: nicotinate (nicotinamide) nucleotide adenylyltransferase [Polyangia bacterium]
MRVAIYGGSFNPPHVAHQMALAYVLATAHVDEVWMVPTFKHPFDKQLASFSDRAMMCELAASPFKAVRVSRVEEELGGESFTLRTMRALMERHGDHRFSLVIGSDLLAERERWHGWPELKELVPFIVIGREGSPSVGGITLPQVSSTIVRQRLATGEPVDALVASAVVDYIRARGLYR